MFQAAKLGQTTGDAFCNLDINRVAGPDDIRIGVKGEQHQSCDWAGPGLFKFLLNSARLLRGISVDGGKQARRSSLERGPIFRLLKIEVCIYRQRILKLELIAVDGHKGFGPVWSFHVRLPFFLGADPTPIRYVA